MFNDNIFITEYLKIINEENTKNDDPNDGVKPVRAISVRIFNQNDFDSEIPELNEAIKFDAIDGFESKLKDSYPGSKTAANALVGFIKVIQKTLSAVEFTDELKQKLEKREEKISEADKKKQEDKENKEKTEVSAQQDGEGETTKAETAKKNPETM